MLARVAWPHAEIPAGPSAESVCEGAGAILGDMSGGKLRFCGTRRKGGVLEHVLEMSGGETWTWTKIFKFASTHLIRASAPIPPRQPLPRFIPGQSPSIGPARALPNHLYWFLPVATIQVQYSAGGSFTIPRLVPTVSPTATTPSTVPTGCYHPAR